MNAAPEKNDRPRASDAGRSDDRNRPDYTQEWPRVVQRIRLAQLAHHSNPIVSAIATAAIVQQQGGGK